MKKADFMTGFLFWTLLGIIIIIPTTLWASKFFKLSDKAAGSYSQLVSLIGNIRDGELLSMPLYMDDNSAIIGVTKNSKRFEAKSQQGSATSLAYYEVTDPKCQGKTCICHCKEMGYEIKSTFETKITCKESRCNPFEDLEFLKIRPLNDLNIQTSSSNLDKKWENGFIIFTQTKATSDVADYGNFLVSALNFGGLIEEVKKRNKVVYIQRYRNYVNVCYNRICITDDTKNNILATEVAQDIKDFT